MITDASKCAHQTDEHAEDAKEPAQRGTTRIGAQCGVRRRSAGADTCDEAPESFQARPIPRLDARTPGTRPHLDRSAGSLGAAERGDGGARGSFMAGWVFVSVGASWAGVDARAKCFCGDEAQN